ncbi:21744_t:CDS:10 [Racocetra persica]|uniref:21744_t:CDS:1 n=1 Tax=Racocetra persica TaxID=160502 RepID=A0ACA9Q4L8_9GLOM|nr:21744_t:CDS:10 [Racocetra persica]
MSNTDEIYPGRTGKHGTDPSLWSYVDFLKLNRTLIINSPPFKDQWNTLDGTWNKRFIQAGKELLDLTLGEAFESKVNLERAKSNLYSFWQEVITERLRLQVQITYEKETLLTFDESGKFFGRQLRLPYNKEATSSDDKRVFDSTLDSDLISPVGAKKIKSCKGDVNVEKANGDSAIKMTSTAYQQFTNKYQKIPKEDKWTLSTEKIVEDALYVFGMKCSHEHLCHSFLIDPDDKNYIQQGIFTREELEEIKNFSKKELPLVPDDLLKYLNSFRKSNTSDLRELIFRSDLRDQPFDRSKNFDYDWIRNTIYNLVLEYEANHLEKDHLETWIMLHVWSFIDKAFLDIEGMEIVRGESCSYASSNRKNSQRVVASTEPMKRKAMGRRGDLIIRKWHTEYGCSEAGKIFEGINGTKIIKEGGLKMPKMLRDMFIDLCKTMEMRKNKIRRLETVGFIISGLRISLLRLDLPAGHVCRLSRTRLFEMPTQISEFGAKALPTISLVWKAKLKMLQNCDESGFTTPPPRLQLMSSSVTPESKRMNKNDEE